MDNNRNKDFLGLEQLLNNNFNEDWANLSAKVKEMQSTTQSKMDEMQKNRIEQIQFGKKVLVVVLSILFLYYMWDLFLFLLTILGAIFFFLLGFIIVSKKLGYDPMGLFFKLFE